MTFDTCWLPAPESSHRTSPTASKTILASESRSLVILRLLKRGQPTVTRAILGSIDQIEDVLHSHVVDEVAVCLPPVAARHLEPIAGLAAGEGKTVRIPLDPVEDLLPSAIQEEFDGFRCGPWSTTGSGRPVSS